MVGTLFNTATVAIGASLGLAAGKHLNDSMRTTAFQALGLFTLGIGIHMSLEAVSLFAIFLALIVGAALGQLLRLQDRVTSVTAQLGDGTGPALVQSLVLFCAGAMTLIGCMQDGLQGNPTVLFIKGSMDFVSSAFLAAALGRGVLFAAPALLVLQGALTWAFALWGAGWSESLLADLTGFGGLLLLALGLDLLKIRSFPLLNFVPGFILIPLFQPVAEWVQSDLPHWFLA